MKFEELPSGDKRLLLETELEIRAASLSFSALARAIRNEGYRLEGSRLARARKLIRLDYLDRTSTDLFSANALGRLYRTGGFTDESRDRDMTVKGSRDLELLQVGAQLLLEKELQAIQQANDCEIPTTEEKHRYGADFMPTLRKINVAIDSDSLISEPQAA